MSSNLQESWNSWEPLIERRAEDLGWVLYQAQQDFTLTFTSREAQDAFFAEKVSELLKRVADRQRELFETRGRRKPIPGNPNRKLEGVDGAEICVR